MQRIGGFYLLDLSTYYLIPIALPDMRIRKAETSRIHRTFTMQLADHDLCAGTDMLLYDIAFLQAPTNSLDHFRLDHLFGQYRLSNKKCAFYLSHAGFFLPVLRDTTARRNTRTLPVRHRFGILRFQTTG